MSKRDPWRFLHRRTKSKGDDGNFHPEAKRIAYLRVAIVKAYHEALFKGGRRKADITEEFLELYNSGMILPEGFEKPENISRSTLLGWDKLYRDRGFAGLIPRYKWKPRPGAAVVPIKLTPKHKEIIISGPPKRRAKYEFLPEINHQWEGPPLDCAIRLSISYSMPVRKGTKMPRRMKMLKHRISHRGKPNLGTLNAFVVDCLTGIVFKDHSQIVQFNSKKQYHWWPQIRILIRALSG